MNNKCADVNDAETETNDTSDIDQSLSGDEMTWNEGDNEPLMDDDDDDDDNDDGDVSNTTGSDGGSVYAGTHQSDENSSLDLNYDDEFVDHVYD